MLRRVGLWPLRVLWGSLPLTAGAALADAVDTVSTAPGVLLAVAAWGVWAGVLLALLVPLPVTLTAVRIGAPCAPAAIVWAMAATGGDAGGALGVVGGISAAGTTVLALMADTADRFVHGASYGRERRFALRAPAALALGPAPLAWLVATSGTLGGPLLAANRQVVLAIPVWLVGWATAALAVRALHGLSRRWLVFVPNGLVVHDPFLLRFPMPLSRRAIRRIGAARPPGGDRAPAEPAPTFGLRLAITMDPPAQASLRGGAAAEWVEVSEVIVAPARPAAVLDEARDRRLPVG